ncbi:hypothetical protein OHAE_5133 [Ochrobactrum soli]|uniref:Uncharacterized protein n=1 Tax=Ochrobactrum soli TaxID=2448455 RepID=A0A2P9HEK0_9HYPH|nr:hypothetical protein OHAE_5133 [[Ochrobactrum] soli]
MLPCDGFSNPQIADFISFFLIHVPPQSISVLVDLHQSLSEPSLHGKV